MVTRHLVQGKRIDRVALVWILLLGSNACAVIDALRETSQDARETDEFPLRFHGEFSAGSSPVALALGGHPDANDLWIASVNGNASQVTMIARDMRTPGDLAIAEVLAVGSTPVAATMADFNGDGLDDLAVASRGAREVRVFFQTGGSPAFSSPVVLASPSTSEPEDIAALDVSGDSNLDIVIATGPELVAFVRASEPTDFLPGFVVEVGFPVGSAIAVADIDGDGLADIAGGEGEFAIFYQDSPGAFARRGFMDFQTHELVIAHFEPDDLIAVLPASFERIDIWNPDLVDTRRLVKQGEMPVAAQIRDLAVGQLAGDGAHVDVVTVGADITLCVRDSDNVDPAAVHTIEGGGLRTAVVVADVDDDGRDDLIVANQQQATVSVYLHD